MGYDCITKTSRTHIIKMPHWLFLNCYILEISWPTFAVEIDLLVYIIESPLKEAYKLNGDFINHLALEKYSSCRNNGFCLSRMTVSHSIRTRLRVELLIMKYLSNRAAGVKTNKPSVSHRIKGEIFRAVQPWSGVSSSGISPQPDELFKTYLEVTCLWSNS